VAQYTRTFPSKLNWYDGALLSTLLFHNWNRTEYCLQNVNTDAAFEAVTATTMRGRRTAVLSGRRWPTISRVILPPSLGSGIKSSKQQRAVSKRSQNFGGTHCLRLQDRRANEVSRIGNKFCLIFDIEDRGSAFLRKVSEPLPDYTTLQTTR
jgi:hypothetical protein